MVSALTIAAVVLSGLSTLFAVIVLGVVSDKAKETIFSQDICVYHKDPRDTAACDFGIAMGAIGFIFGLGFLALALLDLLKPDLLPSAVQSVVKLARIIGAGGLAFLFLVCFAVMVHNWSDAHRDAYSDATKNGANGGIAFSFFSILSWGGLGVLYIIALRSGGSSGASSAAATSAPA